MTTTTVAPHPDWETSGDCRGDHYMWRDYLSLQLEVGEEYGEPFPTTIAAHTVWFEDEAKSYPDTPDFPIVSLHIYGSGVDHSQMLLPAEARHIAAELIAAAIIAEGGAQ